MERREKVLVTGGAGYIGSHTIVELLVHGGWEVVSMDNLSNADASVFDRIEEITGTRVRNHVVDLCDMALLQKAVSTEPGITGVIHFAALKSVPDSVADPHGYYRNNILSLLNILEACRSAGIPHFIFSSSCSVYGNIAQLPVKEDTPLGRAESPYAYTKQVGERIVDDVAGSIPGMRAISLRYFNPVGAHATALIGEAPSAPPASLVPVITRTAAGLRPSMTVHGSDYDTRDGSCIRDFIHVSDIAEAHVKALERAYSGAMDGPCEVFNLGTGDGVSVLEAIAAFERVAGVKLPYSIGPRRTGDVGAIYSDTTRSRKVLGWTARRNLEEMMRSAWAWEQYAREHLVHSKP